MPWEAQRQPAEGAPLGRTSVIFTHYFSTLTAMETIKGAMDSAKKAMLGEEVGGGWERGLGNAAARG